MPAIAIVWPSLAHEFGHMGVVAGREALFFARAVGAFAVKVVGAGAARAEGEEAAVWRPHLLGLCGVIEGQAGWHTAFEVVDPDIEVAIPKHRQRRAVCRLEQGGGCRRRPAPRFSFVVPPRRSTETMV